MLDNELKEETINMDNSNEEVIEKEIEKDIKEDIKDVPQSDEDLINEKLLEQEKLANDYLDKLQRTMAEYDNFRKRTIKEKALMYDNGAKEVCEKILPVVDNFERALEMATEDEKESSFVQGIELIYKQLLNTLQDLGVKEIEALNKEFDLNYHHAVFHEEREDCGENQVVEVLQKGYMYKDKVLRFSMVKVAN